MCTLHIDRYPFCHNVCACRMCYWTCCCFVFPIATARPRSLPSRAICCKPAASCHCWNERSMCYTHRTVRNCTHRYKIQIYKEKRFPSGLSLCTPRIQFILHGSSEWVLLSYDIYAQFLSKSRKHGTQQESYWFSMQTVFFHSSFIHLARREHTHTRARNANGIELKCHSKSKNCGRNAVFCMPFRWISTTAVWRFIFGWLEWTLPSLLDVRVAPTNLCYAWICLKISSLISIDFE